MDFRLFTVAASAADAAEVVVEAAASVSSVAPELLSREWFGVGDDDREARPILSKTEFWTTGVTLASVKLAVVNLVAEVEGAVAAEEEVTREEEDEEAEVDGVVSRRISVVLSDPRPASLIPVRIPFPRPAAAMHFSFVVLLISGCPSDA